MENKSKLETEGRKLAKLLESSYRNAQSASMRFDRPIVCTGRAVYENYRPHINKWLSDDSQLKAYAEKNGVQPSEVFSELGTYLFNEHISFNRDKSAVRGMISNPIGVAKIVAIVRAKKQQQQQYRVIMLSILRSIQYLCKATFKKNKMGKPSETLMEIIKGKNLWRFMNASGINGLSYHYLSLVPDMDNLVDKYATTHVDPSKPDKRLMDPEYENLQRALPVYRADAQAACGFFGFKRGSILDVTDNYYTEHLDEIARLN